MPLLKATTEDAFPRFEAGSVLYVGNMFNQIPGFSYDWNIPTTSDDAPCSGIINGECTLTLRGVGNNTNGPAGYPAALLGSMGGRYETSGVNCNNFQIIGGQRDLTGSPSPVYDLRIPQAEIGLPDRVSDLAEIEIFTGSRYSSLKRPNANFFIDGYLYDTTQNPPLDEYSGTVNGINASCNRMINPNIWYGHPNQDAMWDARVEGRTTTENLLITQYTGGNVAGEVTIDGNVYKIVFKHELNGNNNFLYIAFVLVVQAGGKPDPLTFYIRYNSVLDYLLSDAFWNDHQARIASIASVMANPPGTRKPLNLVRPNGAMYLDMVSVGNEFWGNYDDDPTEITWSTLAIVVDGTRYGSKGELFPVPTAYCEMPITFFGPNVRACELPIVFIGSFGCELPLVFQGGIQPVDLPCDKCPDTTTVINRIAAPYGSEAIDFSLERFFNILEGTEISLDEVSTEGLTGIVLRNGNKVTYKPPEQGCDTECGKLALSFRYRCALNDPQIRDETDFDGITADTTDIDSSLIGSSPQFLAAQDEPEIGAAVVLTGPAPDTSPTFTVTPVEDLPPLPEPDELPIFPEVLNREQSCVLEFNVCSFPDVERLPDVCVRLEPGVTEYLIPVQSTEVPDGAEVCSATMVGSGCGTVKWIGSGYLFRIPARAFGCFRLTVPSYPVGDKAHSSKRCVDIIVPAPEKATELPECCDTTLLIKKACDSVYTPVGRLTDIGLTFEEIRRADFVDFETCETVVADAERHEWSISASMTAVLGAQPLMSGQDYDIRLVFDIRRPSRAHFTGSARASGFSLNMNSSTTSRDKVTQIQLTGKGSYCAVGFTI